MHHHSFIHSFIHSGAKKKNIAKSGTAATGTTNPEPRFT